MVDYFATLMLDEFVERVQFIFTRYFKTFFILSLAAYIVPCIPMAIFYVGFMEHFENMMDQFWTDNEATTQDAFTDFVDHLAGLQAMLLSQTALYCLFTIIGRGGMIHAVAEIYAGKTPEWTTSIQRGARSICGLLCIGMFMLLVVAALNLVIFLLGILMVTSNNFKLIVATAMMGLVVLYVGLFYISVAWMIAFPVIVIENKDACSGFSRTFELTSGRRMTVYSCIFLYLLFQLVVGWTWQALCFLLPLSKFLVPLNFLPGLFFLPIHAILQTVVYLNLRIDKESLNVDVLQRDLSMDDSRYTPLLSLEEDDQDERDHDNGGDDEKVVSFAADPETVNKVHETSEVV